MASLTTTTERPVWARRACSRLVAPAALVHLAPAGLLLVLLATLPSVFSRTGLLSLLLLASILGIAAIGQTWAVLIGGIDLSIPAVMGMADVLLTTRYAAGWSPTATFLLIAVLAVVIGVANGIGSSVLGLHPLIVTLATGAITTGAVLQATHGDTGGKVPGFVTEAVSPGGRTGPFPVPLALVLWVVLAAVVVLVERRGVLGRHVYALGTNRTAASLALVRPMRTRVAVYTVSALGAAVAGVLLGGFSGGASADIGAPYLFSTITAVVVGGTSLLGGRGGYPRTISGVLVTIEMTMLLIGFDLDASMQQVLLGLLILVLVALYGRDKHIAQRI
ncbi:ABC transporter permease [Actinomadura roseirufa]|uniref:ABC transporter permease n=1 Tax=Actinomadura roseirufa TaxID=2094049 RepID=UPI0010410F48|nr:ABC transporter permease [Actinomadura roseirufa]